MSVYGIDEIIAMLDWRNSKATQSMGIEAGCSIKCIKAFFQPLSDRLGKNVWDNCALIVCSHTDEALNPYIVDMLLWLQDLNWPGALKIMQRLQRFENVSVLATTIMQMLPALVALEDTTWLINISSLLDNRSLAECVDSETFALLTKFRAEF